MNPRAHARHTLRPDRKGIQGSRRRCPAPRRLRFTGAAVSGATAAAMVVLGRFTARIDPNHVRYDDGVPMNQQQVQQWHVKARALAELYISARYYEKLGTRRANTEDCLRRLMEHLDTDPSRDAQQAWVE